MCEVNTELRKEAWACLKPVQMIHLATWDGTHPKVRPVSLIFDDDRFWFCTGSNDAKVEQIEKHPVFEFSLMLEKGESRGTLRCSGDVRIVTDQEEKYRISGRIPFFGQYWDSPEDPTFCLFELLVEDVEFMTPGEMIASRFKA